MSRRPASGETLRRPLAQAPAVRALLIQAGSCLLVLVAAYWLPTYAQPSVAAAALGQGLLAAALSRWRRLAPWWLPIQLVFPLALVAMLSLRLPPWIFLCAFILMLGLYWSAFRTQVPYYPSRLPVWNAVAGLLPADRPIRFVDVGSGLGGVTMHLAALRPESVFAGIEVAPLPWLASAALACMRRSRARFFRGDYRDLDFASYDVVFAYLSPAAMPALWAQASARMRPGTLLLSYEFAIPGVAPDFATMPAGGAAMLYGWRMNTEMH